MCFKFKTYSVRELQFGLLMKEECLQKKSESRSSSLMEGFTQEPTYKFKKGFPDKVSQNIYL